MRKLIFMSLSLVFLNSKLLAASAHLSESEIFEYQTVELVLSGSQNSTPDLAPLEKVFEILNTSTQSSMQIVNGQVQISENNVHLRLQPKRTGLLNIPPIKFGSELTPALELLVKPLDAEVRREIGQMAFFEVSVSEEQPYQGEAVFVTRSLYYAPSVQIYGSLPGAPQVAGATLRPVGDPKSNTQVRNGKRFDVFESRYVLFADQPGRLLIPEVQVMGRMQVRSFNGGSAAGIPIRSPEVILDVLAPPDVYPASKPWLPARNLSISSEFDTRRSEVGAPLTFDLDIEVEDALSSQIAPLEVVFPAAIKSYPESPRLEDESTSRGLLGRRLERYSLIPTNPGIFTLPEVSITWWDTQNRRVREARLASREIEILPNPEFVSTQTQAVDNSPPPVSQLEGQMSKLHGNADESTFDWLNLLLIGLCLILATGWFLDARHITPLTKWRRKTRADATREQIAFEKITGAQGIAQTLIAFREWLRLVPRELHADAEALIDQAEQSLYAHQPDSSSAPSLQTLRRTAKEIRKSWLNTTRERAQGLPKLHPIPRGESAGVTPASAQQSPEPA